MDNLLSLTELSGLNILYEHIFNSLLGQQPVYVFWKDKNGRYLGTNDAGFQSFGDIIGKTDYDLSCGKTASTARNNDLEILMRETQESFLNLLK